MRQSPLSKRSLAADFALLTPAGLMQLIPAHAWRRFARAFGLSPRELQIARELCANRKTSRLNRVLGIQPSTGRGYTRRVYRKARVHNRVDLLVRLFGILLFELSKKPANNRRQRPSIRGITLAVK